MHTVEFIYCCVPIRNGQPCILLLIYFFLLEEEIGEVGLELVVRGLSRGREMLSVRCKVLREVAHDRLEIFRNDEVAVAEMKRVHSAGDDVLLGFHTLQGLEGIKILLFSSSFVASDVNW